MMRPAFLLAFAFFTGVAEAADQPFLFDVLQAGRSPSPYRASWERLIKLVQPTPDWLAQFNRNFDGVAGQITPVVIDGKAYELSFVCKPSDCAAHKFVVLFEAGGARAFGALGGKDNETAFFGAPSQSEQETMAKAVK